MQPLLPPALMDLTILRVSCSPRLLLLGASRTRINHATSRRMHQAVMTAVSPSRTHPVAAEKDIGFQLKKRSLRDGGVLPIQSHLGSTNFMQAEFERKVKALEETIDSEVSQVSASESLAYSEDELVALYLDVLAIPAETPDTNNEEVIQRQEEEDLLVIQSLDQRFQELPIDEESLSFSGSENATSHTHGLIQSVLSRAHTAIMRLEKLRTTALALPNPENPSSAASYLPVSILSIRECEALVRVCLQSGDAFSAELAIDIMKRSGLPVPSDTVTQVLELYTKVGNIARVEHILDTYLTEAPTEQQRHLHVKAHIKSSLSDDIPNSVLSTLHSYESKAIPAPMRTYAAVIASLFSKPSTISRAQAWDLFSHMRYVAHPEPDVQLYTLIIRQCASPISPSISSEPEKALDFWTEMTVDCQLHPTQDAYNAVILACARSGSKTYVNEAFRLAREMLDSHRDAFGRSEFVPDRNTFCALLEGAKRLGDLARARWILAELVRGSINASLDENVPSAVGVDEEIMMHVFHTYATYRPPFNRSATSIKEYSDSPRDNVGVEIASPQMTQQGEVTSRSEKGSEAADIIPKSKTDPTPTHILPQSHEEVLNEVKFLLHRVIEDSRPAEDTSSHSTTHKSFSKVKISTRLLNSYFAVFHKHASITTTRDLFWKLYEDLGITMYGRTFVEALERCSTSPRGHERNIALKFSDEIWVKWQALEESGFDGHRKLNARLIERAHCAMIRMLSVTNKLDRSMEHVRAFAHRYPPANLRKIQPKQPLRSTRTALSGARPLVRLTSTAEVPDDTVPPLLMFGDVEVLHHRLVAHGRVADVGYLKWLCKSYEFALRARRDEAMKAPQHKSGLISLGAEQ